MSASRRHSVFGDYITTKGKGKPSNEQLSDVSRYNVFWRSYVRSCGWGNIPTKKGFEKWLKQAKEG